MKKIIDVQLFTLITSWPTDSHITGGTTIDKGETGRKMLEYIKNGYEIICNTPLSGRISGVEYILVKYDNNENSTTE